MCNLVTLPQTTNKITFPHTRGLNLVTGTISQAVSRPAWGIDPGVNFGLTIIEGEDVYVYHGALTQTDVPGEYGWYAHNLLAQMIREYKPAGGVLVIEGAAYGAPFRQVELAEIRGGFFLAGVSAEPAFSRVVIKPPKSVRKDVFGNGKTQAMDEFPTLNHNAADSLAIALYAAELECN